MTIIKSASFFGGQSLDGPAQGQGAVMKHRMNKYSFDAGLLFRGTCHGPSDGRAHRGLCCGPGPVSCPEGGRGALGSGGESWWRGWDPQ